MNKVILMGRLTKDPEVRYSQGAEPVAIAKYRLAVNRRYKREGEPDADFIDCVAFGKSGEFAEKYFKKGQMVAVQGRLQIRTYDDQNGVRHWVTEVMIEDQYFAESKASFESRSGSGNDAGFDYYMQQANAPAAQKSGGAQTPAQKDNAAPDGFYSIEENLDDDDLPF